MTSLTIVLTVSATAVWGFAVFIVPQHVNSLFRYRLWRLRDELQDYVFDERLPDTAFVRELQETIEALIQYSEWITLSSSLVLRLVAPKERDGEPSRWDKLYSLPVDQRELIFPILDSLFDSMKFKRIAGSPGGALLLPFWLILFRYYKSVPIEPEKEIQRLRELRGTLGRTRRDNRDLLASVG